MKISRRAVISILVTAIALFAGMLFWPFILNNIIQPIALVAWILLRVLFLSIDQKYFWTAVILVVVIFLFRLLPHEQAESQLDSYPVRNATITTIGYWRILFIYHDQNVRDEKTLKRELAHLLTSLYASKQRAATKFDIYEALRKGEIPIPQHLHSFLFSEEPQESGRWIKKFFRSLQKTPRKWISQWTGQEKAEHNRIIDETLSFMEATLEIKNDR
jgi:hypothetical protein